MSRIEHAEAMMCLAYITSLRSTCIRRRVGAVITDTSGKVISTGFNGVPSNLPHCIDSPCPGGVSPSGKHLDLCMAIHAEQNAVAQCSSLHLASTLYVTTSPCINCIKQLIATNINTIIYKDLYPHEESIQLWESMANRRILPYGPDTPFLSAIILASTRFFPKPR